MTFPNCGLSRGHVLHDGDARHISKGLRQCDLAVGERDRLGHEQVQAPEDQVLEPQWDRAHGWEARL